MTLRFSFLLLLFLSLPVWALAPNSVYAPDFDMVKQCRSIEERIPKKIDAIRKMGNLLSEETGKTRDYGCHRSAQGCSFHRLEFDGMELGIVMTEKDVPYLVTATFSTRKHRLLEQVYVGQSIAELEKLVMMPVPKGAPLAKIHGDCLTLSIWHDGKFVTKFSIDCDCS